MLRSGCAVLVARSLSTRKGSAFSPGFRQGKQEIAYVISNTCSLWQGRITIGHRWSLTATKVTRSPNVSAGSASTSTRGTKRSRAETLLPVLPKDMVRDCDTIGSPYPVITTRGIPIVTAELASASPTTRGGEQFDAATFDREKNVGRSNKSWPKARAATRSSGACLRLVYWKTDARNAVCQSGGGSPSPSKSTTATASMTIIVLKIFGCSVLTVIVKPKHTEQEIES